MGLLDPPILPPLLYRYRGLTDATIAREIKAIREQILWCSFYRELNDPMEGFYSPRLGYGIVPPEIGMADTGNLNDAALKVLSHKKSSWGYEREWRVIAQRGALPVTAEGCIRDVFLGSRIADAHRTLIEDGLSDLPVRISAMKIDKYAHKWMVTKTIKKTRPKLAAE